MKLDLFLNRAGGLSRGVVFILVGALAAIFLILGSTGQEICRAVEPDPLIISEILANPIGKDTQGEFIEIYNPNTNTIEIDLTGWQIDDLIGSGSHPFYFSAIAIQPGEARAFYYSETKIALNNSGDEVNLLNADGDLVSSVSYAQAEEGKSWARLSSIYQWLEPTPGIVNYRPPEILKIEIEPNFIDYTKSAEVSFNTEISDPDKKLKKAVFSLPYPFEKEIEAGESWLYQAGEIATPLSLQIEIRAIDIYGLERASYAELFFYQESGVEISEIYPAPLTGEEEFIELFNPGSTLVNLKFYQLDDIAGGSHPYIFGEEVISAFGYLILGQSRTGVRLNNNGDSVRLLAPDSRELDSLIYSKSRKGRSLSRFREMGENSWEWTDLITPGLANQKRIYSMALFISEVLPNPTGKDKEGEFIEIYNSGFEAVDLTGWQIDDGRDFGSAPYTFRSVLISPKEFLAIPYSQSKIILNNGGDWVYLINADGEVVSSLHYANAGKSAGYSYALFNNRYFWTNQPTPGESNLMSELPKNQQTILEDKTVSGDRANSDRKTASGDKTRAKGFIDKSESEMQETAPVWYMSSGERMAAVRKKIIQAGKYLIEPLVIKAYASAAGLTGAEPAVLGAQVFAENFQSSASWAIIRYAIVAILILGALKLWRFIKLKTRTIQKE